MGKLTYNQMKELLETTLDTMDRYNRVIRQLLEDYSDDEPTEGDSNKEDIIEIKDIEIKDIESSEKISDIVEGEIDIENINQQIEKVHQQLNTGVSVEVEPKRVDVYKLAEEFIKSSEVINNNNFTDKDLLYRLYGEFRDGLNKQGLRPMGKFAFNKIVAKMFTKLEPEQETLYGENDYISSGVHDYTLTPDNIDMIKPRLRVGDVVGINHSILGTIAFQVAGINIDGPNVVTLISKDCVTKRRFDESTGIYKESEIRKWLNEEFLFKLEIMDKIVAVEKKSFGDYSHMRVVKSIEYCWLPSRDELLIDTLSSDDITENTGYPLFKDSASRIKKYEGEPEKYFTRSVIKCNINTDTYNKIYSKSTYMNRIKGDGQITQGSVGTPNGIVVGLCI